MSHAIDTDWDKKEFKAYLLLYAARANYFESEEEKDKIVSMVDYDTYHRIHKEIEHDNDYQSIQKILKNIEKFNYSKESLDHLIDDIQAVFDAKGEHNVLEDNMLLALKKLFSVQPKQ